jgi:hypothetical protein
MIGVEVREGQVPDRPPAGNAGDEPQGLPRQAAGRLGFGGFDDQDVIAASVLMPARP